MSSLSPIDQERARIAREATDCIARRGEPISRAVLATELGMPRARIEALFEDDEALFAAIIDEWYREDADFMAQLVQSDLPVQRKMYEFYVQRYRREKARYDADPAAFALFLELGTEKFELVRGYIELADHHLVEIIAEAQSEGYFADLSLDRALTLINQMMICYTSPQMMVIVENRLAEDKLAAIIDTIFAGLSGKQGHATGLHLLRQAEGTGAIPQGG